MTLTTSGGRFDAVSDVGVMAERLARESALAGTADWGRLEIPRVLPCREGFAVQYVAPAVDGGSTMLWGELGVTSGRPFDVERHIRFDDLDLSIPVFPHDPDLPDLARLLERSRGERLAETLGWNTGTAASVTILAYRLRRRCVVRWVTTNGDAAAVKMVRRRKLSGLTSCHARGQETAARGEALSVPRILDVDEALGACVLEWMPGTTLHELGDDPAAVGAHRHAGASLRDLHRGDVGDLEPIGSDAELRGLSAWTGVLERVRPDLVDGHRDRCTRLAFTDWMAGEGAGLALAHADYYDKQVLVDGDATSLIDLDGLAAADPARDLGNALAHMELRRLQGRLSDETPARFGDALLDGYGDAPAPRALAWWKAASLARLSALYAIRPRWRHLAQPLLEEVDACLASNSRR